MSPLITPTATLFHFSTGRFLLCFMSCPTNPFLENPDLCVKHQHLKTSCSLYITSQDRPPNNLRTHERRETLVTFTTKEQDFNRLQKGAAGRKQRLCAEWKARVKLNVLMQSQKSSQSSQSGFHSSKCTSGRNKSLMQIMMCTSLIWRKKPSTNNSFTQHHRPSVHVSTRPAACVHGLNHKRMKWRDCWTVSYAQISPRHQILWTSITQPLHDIYSH